ncbi:hypothetical protein HMPREF3156_00338 [Neisseria sp. HMSC06F02]|nr:hypothetical protein HMPREF3156_00338 [Neisseria sp. HMSC06F02]
MRRCGCFINPHGQCDFHLKEDCLLFIRLSDDLFHSPANSTMGNQGRIIKAIVLIYTRFF